ncbi:MAG: hypothetical protein M3Q47_19210 [Actinomycetota bacterium]|nr:hypothetical protein [Actinomycetota bacterium]
MGSQELLEQYDAACFTGRLPAGAHPAVWRPLLERELRAQRRGRRFVPAIGALGRWVTVVLVEASEAGPLGWAPAVVGAVLIVASAWLAIGDRTRQVQRLLAQLPEPESPTVHSPAG